MYKKIGWTLTLIWLSGIFWYLHLRWENVWRLYPNEMGDLLAGAVAPLAFLWLVIGYFQQGEELKQNTHALRMQAEELKNSVEQQRIIARANLEEIEHLKEAAQFAKLERQASLSPIFKSQIKLTNDVGDYVAHTQVINHGKTVRHVTVSLYSTLESTAGDLKLETTDSLDLWRDEERKNFAIRVKNPERYLGHLIYLGFEYTNSIGEKGVSRLSSWFDEETKQLVGFELSPDKH